MATSKSTLKGDNVGAIISCPKNGERASLATETSYHDTSFVSATETDVGNLIPFNGTLKNLYVTVWGNDLDAGSTVYTLVKNGSDTTLTLTVAFGVTSTSGDTTHTESVSAGDRITLKAVSTGATGMEGFFFSYQVS